MLNGTNSSDSRCRNPLTEAVCALTGVSCDGWGTILGGAITGMYVPLTSHRRRWCCTLLPRPPLVLHFVLFYHSVLVLLFGIGFICRSFFGNKKLPGSIPVELGRLTALTKLYHPLMLPRVV